MATTADLGSKGLLDALPMVFPWARFLPINGRQAFARDLLEVTSADESADSFAAVVQLITEWRNTAQVHADPELLEILRSPLIEPA